jgi:predicted DNA-binding transcriptional regulator AlpA
MPRHADLSKPILTKRDFLGRFKRGMTANDMQIVTGWSRATCYRRMQSADFPRPVGYRKRRKVWNPEEVLEWLSRFNLQVLLPRDEYLEYERSLKDREFADPVLRTALGRTIERENERRKRARDAPYGEMRFDPSQFETRK